MEECRRRKEIAWCIIDMFEDFLDEKGVTIPNDERDELDDNTANIYGSDFGFLVSRLEEILEEDIQGE